MSRPLLVIRPEPGNRATCLRARALGMEAVGIPLFEGRPLDWTPPNGNFDALLITSANAIRLGGAGLEGMRTLPVWAVGEQSASSARDAGFRVVRTGSAGIAALLADAPPACLLHLCGADRIALPHAYKGSITAVPVYESNTLEPVATLAEALKAAPVILLHSPRAARHLAALVERFGMNRAAIALVAISAAAADGAGSGWEKLAIAGQTSDEAMLDAARLWCGTPE